jgi:hypothetical protein
MMSGRGKIAGENRPGYSPPRTFAVLRMRGWRRVPIGPRRRITCIGLFAYILPFLWIFQTPVKIPAQEPPQHGKQGVAVLGAVVNFKQLAARQALAPPHPERRVIPFMPAPPPRPLPSGTAPAAAQAPAPATSTAALIPSPAPLQGFEALGDNDTVIPPDTMGAAGPNHLMVTLNSQIRIQDKTGTEVSTVSLYSFWSGLSGVTSVFDPKLTYDPFNDRWIFAVGANPESSSSLLLIAASQSSDPTGNWNLYKVTVDGTGTDWGDYPALGFNKDWVVVNLNLFTVSANKFDTGKIFVFNKSDLYAGNATVGLTTFTDSNDFTEAPAVTYDNSLATLYLVESWNGSSGGHGYLAISSITGPVGSEAYNAQVAFVSTANPWASGPPSGADFAPQEGTTHKIQNNDDRILNVVYRNGSLWAAQNAFLPANKPTRTAAQWWQFLPDGTVQQFGRVDDSTGTNFYAFPSIAVNSENDVLLGYSSFSASQYASASYSIRSGDDPPGSMRSVELLKAGEAVYYKTFSGTQNRWGDFSSAVVDPSNDLDFWTIQEYASSPNFPNGDNRWGTWWGDITPPPLKRRGELISQ